MRRSMTGPPPPPPPLKNHKNIGFLSNTGPDPMKNHKATKPVLNVRPSSVHQLNPIYMAFCWWADDGPLIVVFRSSLPISTKKKPVKVGPHLTKFLDPGMSHQDLLFWQRYVKPISRYRKQLNFEIPTCDTLKCIMDHPNLIVSDQLGRFHHWKEG